MAAYDATLPAGCQRTIYLCDDGKVLRCCSEEVSSMHACIMQVS